MGEVSYRNRVLPSPSRLLTPVLAALVLSLLPAAAVAAPATVSVVDDAFTPANVAIAPGETVTWTWDAGGHNVRVTEGPVRFDSGFKDAGGTFSKALPTEGTYRYVCDAHSGMRGVVTVGSGTAPAPTPSGSTAASAAAPRLSSVAVARHAELWLRSSAAGRVRARILRGRRVVRRTTLAVVAGANHISLDVRGLRLGRHRLVLGSGRARQVRRLVVTARSRRRAHTAAPAPASPVAAAPAPAPADDDGTPDRGDDDD